MPRTRKAGPRRGRSGLLLMEGGRAHVNSALDYGTKLIGGSRCPS